MIPSKLYPQFDFHKPKILTLGKYRALATELLQHLGSAGESISALTNRDVQNKLLNLDISHRVLLLLLGRLGNQ